MALYLHSGYAPSKEADRFVENLNIPFSPYAIIISEPALSYLVKPLRKKYPQAKIGVIRYTDFFNSYNSLFDFVINLFEGINLEARLEALFNEEQLLSVHFISWQPSSQVFTEEDKLCWNAIKATLERAKTLLITRQYFEKKWLLNCAGFLRSIKNPVSLKNKIDLPLLIISSGPSFQDAIKVIKKNQNKFFIVCLSSALLPCLENNIIPDLCCKNNTDFFTKKWKIIKYSSIEKFFNFNFVIWRSDEFKKYIVAFPGTRNVFKELPSEIINSRLVNYNEIEDGIKVVSYFYDLVLEIKDLVFSKEILLDIEAHPGYQFICVGHSLGASIAALILYDGINKKYVDSSKNEPVLITFGMPRTGSEKFVLDFNSKIKNVIRVVRDGDIVPDIPFSPFSNSYRHLGGLVLVNKDMTLMNYCPKDIGEDYPDKECRKSFSVNFNYHLYYFNPDTMFSNLMNRKYI